jgi:O-antigen ligase
MTTIRWGTWHGARATAHQLSVLRLATPWLAVGGAAILSGWLATGQAELWLGRTPALLLMAALVGGTFLTVFVFLGSSAVVIWPVAATIGYLWQLPRSQPIITFDRVWIGGLLAYIALTPRPVARTPATRLLRACLLLIVLTFGLRALTTSLSISGPLRTWVDAIVLPALLFVACERYCLHGPNRVRRLTGALMIAGGVLAVIGIAERIWGFELATVTGGSIRFDQGIDQTRISGPYPAPEPYALSLLICLAATLYWILSRPRGSRIVWALALAGIQLTAVGLALFRAGWIGALLVIAASIGLRPGRFGRTFAVVGLVGILALAGTSQLGQNKTVSTRLNDTENVYGRLATYEQGLEIFRSAPLFGIGVNQYHAVAETRPPTTVAGVQAVSYPHSSYVGLLAEQGIVGFLPFIFLSYAVWRLIGALRTASFGNRRAALLMATVAGAALGYLIMSLTLTMLPYGPPNAFFAVFLGAASGYLDTLASENRKSTA